MKSKLSRPAPRGRRRPAGGRTATAPRFTKRGDASAGGQGETVQATILRLKHGLPYQEIEDLAVALDLPTGHVAESLHINKRTLTRRKQAGRLDPHESERVHRLQRLLAAAEAMLRDKDEARLWMRTPQRALSDQTPLQFADTEVGAREVERLIERVRHGVFI